MLKYPYLWNKLDVKYVYIDIELIEKDENIIMEQSLPPPPKVFLILLVRMLVSSFKVAIRSANWLVHNTTYYHIMGKCAKSMHYFYFLCPHNH